MCTHCSNFFHVSVVPSKGFKLEKNIPLKKGAAKNVINTSGCFYYPTVLIQCNRSGRKQGAEMSPDCHSCCACRSVGRAEPWDEDTAQSRAFTKPGEPSRPRAQCSTSGAAGAAARRGAAEQMTSAGGEAQEQVGGSKRKSWREVQSSSRMGPWFPTPPT